MRINEVFRSIQGESSFAGLPCVFVRLTGCNLRCSYCDTKYSYEEGQDMCIREVFDKIADVYIDGDIIEFTGGEPLMQYKELNQLIRLMRKTKYSKTPILIETNGSYPINLIDKKAKCNIIMDWKCPTSGMTDKMQLSNLYLLEKKDELKFVLGSLDDYLYMKDLLENSDPGVKLKCQILISTVWGVDKQMIVKDMLKDGIKARFQIQLHKLIWDINRRGV